MDFEIRISDADVTLIPSSESVFSRLFAKKHDLTAADVGDHDLSLALGDLAALNEEAAGSAVVREDRIILSHDALSRLDGGTARVLGLPPLPDLTLATDVRGVVGHPEFRLSCRWMRDGKPEPVRRTGAILHTGGGDCRIPRALLDAIEVAEDAPGAELAAQWNALARFRSALIGTDADQVGKIAMTDFLAGLEVHLARGFSMAPRKGSDGLDFDVQAHEGRGLDAPPLPADQDSVAARIRERGTLPAYRLAAGSYLVVDEAARPVLEVMARMQRAAPEERDAFVRNPLPYITEAIEADLAARGKLDQLGDADRQEAVEGATKAFVETAGYADRVREIGVYERPPIDFGPESGVTWLPEVFGTALMQRNEKMSVEELRDLRNQIAEAVSAGKTTFHIDGEQVHIDQYAVAALDAEIERRAAAEEPKDQPEGEDGGARSAPIILLPRENFDDLGFFEDIKPRPAATASDLPKALRSTLHPHQIEGFAWAQDAWRGGLPGILNADEQGLGKTLQTIAFLAWLNERLDQAEGPLHGPTLVVAPTSLLENWEGEVARHLEQPGLGTLVRLYGGGLSTFRRAGASGREIEDAEERLDFTLIHEAVAEKRAHRLWLLTTYQTLTNYQYSFGKIPFSVIVFDEIQALKNPGTLVAKAAKAMKGDFRIGLTGTPVENTVTDLWAIIDQLAPGYLGSLKEFRAKYETGEPAPGMLTELHGRLFTAQDPHPAIGLRRLKAQAAKHLPEKTRFLHPAQMPTVQAQAYETARAALAGGGFGAVLKMLHRLRGVSLHPDPGMTEGFEDASARLQAGLKILDRIRDSQARALVFIEDRRMQHRFIALARARYGIDRIDVINGSTRIRQRQEIVDRFQNLLGSNRFNLLVLGPRAAGTGLTLTSATHVLHLSRWWNPAVEEQCNDRAHRIGQEQPVSVHVPLAIHPRYGFGSFDCQLQLLMWRKRNLARETLFPAGESKEDVNILRDKIIEGHQDGSRPIKVIMAELFTRMGSEIKYMESDGSYQID